MGFTPNGNRRYMSPITASKVSKLLNKESIRGGEGFFYGLGSIRSRLAPEFRNITSLKKAENRLVPKVEFEKIKDVYDKKFTDILDLMTEKAKTTSGFGEYDRMGGILGDYYSGDRKILDEFLNLSDSDKSKINDFGKLLSEMPTEYFETKFKRVVDINEFSHALVPEKTSQKVIKLLEDKGLKIEKYKQVSNDVKQTRGQGEALKRLVAEKGLLFGLGLLFVAPAFNEK